MKFTSWNIRGLGGKRKKRIFSNRMKQEAPDMSLSRKINVPFKKSKKFIANGLIDLSF